MKPLKHLACMIFAAVLAMQAAAYEVWLGTHKWEGDAADHLDQWNMAIEKIEGINYVLLDSRADRPAGDGANTNDWRKMIAPIDQSIPGMAEISRSQFQPAHGRTLAERMVNEFAGARNNGGYEIDIIMLYDEATADGTVHEFNLADVQAVRAWLDSNGHSNVSIVFRLTNNDQERLGLAQQSIVDGVLIEASATRWINNNFNVHTLLQDLWTDPKTKNKNIYFQIPRSESANNQYVETRRALKKINELMGNDFMRSDQAIFIVCNYGDTFPTYPETASNDTLYVNSKSGIALSLIEQRWLFEGRTRQPTFADTDSTTRLFAPTVSMIADQIVPANTATSPLAFTIGDDVTAASALTLTKSSSNTDLVPLANIVFGGSGSNRTVTVTPAAGQTGSAVISVSVSDGTLATHEEFTVTVLPPPSNTPPTLSAIADQTIFSNANTGPLAFTVSDDSTPAGSISLNTSSSNTNLIPAANIVLGGSGANRTVTVTPAPNQTGSAMISLIASDGSLSATHSFTLSVLPAGAVSVSVTNNTPGTTVWICPPGVNSVKVECWGGGGAGGAASKIIDTTGNANGGGGGGGAYARKAAVSVTPGNSYPMIIPAAATAPVGSASDLQRFNGSAVTFTGNAVANNTVTAAGGEGGQSRITTDFGNITGLGGAGGTASGSVGDVDGVFAGGTGGNAASSPSGGGGGGAGDANSGGDSPGQTAGIGGVSGGGAGGAGRTGSGNGNPGLLAGGGGAGAKATGSTTGPVANNGGTGGVGQIVLTYFQVPVINQPPVLESLSNSTLIAGQTLQIASLATDSDIPAQTLTFSLVSPPSGASINPATGSFTWRPTIAQSPATHTLTIEVADDGTPSLSTTRSFQVTVQKPAKPILTVDRRATGIADLSLTGDPGPDYKIEASGNLKDWQSIWTNGTTAPPYQFTDPDAPNHSKRFYRVGMGP